MLAYRYQMVAWLLVGSAPVGHGVARLAYAGVTNAVSSALEITELELPRQHCYAQALALAARSKYSERSDKLKELDDAVNGCMDAYSDIPDSVVEN